LAGWGGSGSVASTGAGGTTEGAGGAGLGAGLQALRQVINISSVADFAIVIESLGYQNGKIMPQFKSYDKNEMIGLAAKSLR
jgi:hypothetical protein